MRSTWIVALVAASGLALTAVALDNHQPTKEHTVGGKPAATAPAKTGGPTAEARQYGGVKIGQAAPDFTLPSLNGENVKFSEYAKGSITVVEWFNPECPFVVKHHEKNPTFKNLFKTYNAKGVKFLAINSGAPGKQGNGVEKNKKAAAAWTIGYPILVDEAGEVGQLYGAKTTPHMFIVDKTGKIIYAGAIDNNNSAEKAGDVNYVAKALDEVLAGKPVSESETKPYGCSVKYKSN
jgi:peroxiredoxin